MDAITGHVLSQKFLFEVTIGLTIGLFAGVAGMPLGALRLPAIYQVVPTPQIAAGTNLGIDIFTATIAAYRYWKERLVDVGVLVFMGVPSCVGAFLGGYLSNRFVSYKWLLVVVGLVYFCVGLGMLRSAAGGMAGAGQLRGAESDKGASAKRPGQGHWARGIGGIKGAVAAALCGLLLGFVGGMAGLMMGSLRVPAMIKLVGLAPAMAAGTNMVISSFFAVSGFAGHLIHKNLDLSVLLTVGTASMIGSYAGSHLGVTLNPLTANRLIGVAIILMAIVLLVTGFRL